MPIMAAQSRSDARSAARLLASTARDCINEPEAAPERETALNNVYRLLEAYRVNTFFGLEPPTKRYPEGAAETLTLMPPVEQHLREVRDALEQARAVAFADQSKDHAIEAIANVLRAVTYPQEFKQPSEIDRNNATRFFEEMLDHLKLV